MELLIKNNNMHEKCIWIIYYHLHEHPTEHPRICLSFSYMAPYFCDSYRHNSSWFAHKNRVTLNHSYNNVGCRYMPRLLKGSRWIPALLTLQRPWFAMCFKRISLALTRRVCDGCVVSVINSRTGSET